MSNIIDFPGKGPPPPPSPDKNVITQGPLRLRWGDWRTLNIIQVHVQPAADFEDKRAELLAQGKDPVTAASMHMPPHFTLDGGMRDTALALLRWRNNEAAQIETSYLAALMEALVNAPCPVLRTDLIRRVYQEVETLSKKLLLHWRGGSGRFMLPLGEDAGRPDFLKGLLAEVDNLQDFFDLLRDLAEKRHQSLAKGYVIYYPRKQSL